MKQIRSLIVPVAGIGSRLQPLTHITTKEMVRLVDKPIFYYILQEAYLAGIRHIIFIIHKEKKNLKNFLTSPEANMLKSDFPSMSFSFVETSERRGDGQAILQAQKMIGNEKVFAVTMSDLLSLPGTSILAELVSVYKNNSKPVISVENVDRSRTNQYGVINPKMSRGRLHQIASIVEKPKPDEAPSTLIMTGKYVLTKEIFKYIERLMKDNKNGEIKLAHALSAYAREHTLQAYRCEARHYDTGTKIDLLTTEIAFSAQHSEFGKKVRGFIKTLKK